METLAINIPARSKKEYPVLIGEGALRQLSKITEHFDSTALLFDAAVQDITKTIASEMKVTVMVSVASGEKSKSLTEVEHITSELLKNGINRESLLINIGGGMLTDLGGFVASSYMRGIEHINVPTTLLGIVDASIGGKTGVNIGEAKNIIGQIHHPSAVIIDPDVLKTLPADQFCEGLVEIIKMAAMLDAEFFAELKRDMEKIMSRESPVLISCIRKAIALKAEVVKDDERDSGRRLFLNFGHTVGHALEVLSDFELSHGQAVSIGMVCEMQLANTKNAERVITLLERIGMHTELPKKYTASDLIDAMKRDKKATSATLKYTAPQNIGEGAVLELDSGSFMQNFS